MKRRARSSEDDEIIQVEHVKTGLLNPKWITWRNWNDFHTVWLPAYMIAADHEITLSYRRLLCALKPGKELEVNAQGAMLDLADDENYLGFGSFTGFRELVAQLFWTNTVDALREKALDDGRELRTMGSDGSISIIEKFAYYTQSAVRPWKADQYYFDNFLSAHPDLTDSHSALYEDQDDDDDETIVGDNTEEEEISKELEQTSEKSSCLPTREQAEEQGFLSSVDGTGGPGSGFKNALLRAESSSKTSKSDQDSSRNGIDDWRCSLYGLPPPPSSPTPRLRVVKRRKVRDDCRSSVDEQLGMRRQVAWNLVNTSFNESLLADELRGGTGTRANFNPSEADLDRNNSQMESNENHRLSGRNGDGQRIDLCPIDEPEPEEREASKGEKASAPDASRASHVCSGPQSPLASDAQRHCANACFSKAGSNGSLKALTIPANISLRRILEPRVLVRDFAPVHEPALNKIADSLRNELIDCQRKEDKLKENLCAALVGTRVLEEYTWNGSGATKTALSNEVFDQHLTMLNWHQIKLRAMLKKIQLNHLMIGKYIQREKVGRELSLLSEGEQLKAIATCQEEEELEVWESKQWRGHQPLGELMRQLQLEDLSTNSEGIERETAANLCQFQDSSLRLMLDDTAAKAAIPNPSIELMGTSSPPSTSSFSSAIEKNRPVLGRFQVTGAHPHEQPVQRGSIRAQPIIAPKDILKSAEEADATRKQNASHAIRMLAEHEDISKGRLHILHNEEDFALFKSLLFDWDPVTREPLGATSRERPQKPRVQVEDNVRGTCHKGRDGKAGASDIKGRALFDCEIRVVERQFETPKDAMRWYASGRGCGYAGEKLDFGLDWEGTGLDEGRE